MSPPSFARAAQISLVKVESHHDEERAARTSTCELLRLANADADRLASYEAALSQLDESISGKILELDIKANLIVHASRIPTGPS